ncbi:MAG: 4Fe-4S dicluster domain-containing protein [Verrucomicrobia bacterium]|nr:4Fe-4S dicluster domain-containing protein [Verrucomicrobiota bacterium]
MITEVNGVSLEVKAAPAPAAGTEVDLAFVDRTIARLGRAPDTVIPVLQAIQEHFGYLPQEALQHVCRSTDITPAAITGVSSFYDMFRHQPVGKYIVRVCRGTACHVTGAERVEDALRRRLRIPAGDDTDPDREFTVEPVACLGCCTLAPVVKIDETTFGHTTAEKVPGIIQDFLARMAAGDEAPTSTETIHRPRNGRTEIHVGLGSCCMAKGSDRLFHALQEGARQTGTDVVVKRVGCVGMCHRTPLVEVATAGKRSAFYAGLTPAHARALVQRHFRPRGFFGHVSRLWTRALDSVLTDQQVDDQVQDCALDVREPGVLAFLGKQIHIATEHFGRLDPLSLDEYLAHDGFTALRQCLGAPDPQAIVGAIEQSGLRGRGGAGFPTGRKWRVVRQQTDDTKYVICNGDEGDPGAFMDRMILESFPFRVIEGMAIAAVAIGAHEGIFYIRHEYPLAVRRVRAALAELEKRGWLGERLLEAAYPLRLTVKEGAGAFVCGEETALIESLEGRRGMPRLRPPFPAESGLWAKPTLINNVETLAMVPWIVRHGPERFATLGTATSKGTKVFALAGQIRRGGLIEIPMGTTVREIVEDIGGGVKEGRRFKAVQIGGPSGGCVPARLADTPVDYESLREVGAIMGSGGLVVLDDSACMVDIARYFLQFTQDQSCGKCTFCRIGTKRMLDILDRLCAGKGQKQDLAALEQLAAQVSQGSLCGLGKTAPNPVLTTLRYYRHEYEAHLQGRCPAGKCSALIQYRITADCTGCTLCAQHCPVDAIPMVPYQRHAINLDLCTRCDSCRQVCPHHAVQVS